jgi:glyoxylase-like metal-dependent hydrolase (beta-lactamase superfamily II)
MSGIGWGRLRQPVLVGLLTHPVGGQWLIDTGTHPRLWRQSAWVRLFLWAARMNIPPGPLPVADVRGIFLSHFHLDHGAGLLDFPGLPVATSRQGYQWAQGTAARWRGWCPSLMPADLAGRALWLEDLPAVQQGPVRGGDFFGDGSVLTVPLPGHAPGQHGLLCDTEQGRVFFVADAAAHSACLREDRTQRLPCLIATDGAAERQTRHFLGSLKSWCWMVPSHCPLAYRSGPLAYTCSS